MLDFLFLPIDMAKLPAPDDDDVVVNEDGNTDDDAIICLACFGRQVGSKADANNIITPSS
jgi:hypothetical protein